MNKEVNYVWQGFFLMLVVAAGVGFISVLASIRPSEVSETVTRSGERAAELTVADLPVATENREHNARGASLFKENCRACHAIEVDCDVLSLKTVEDRVKNRQLLYGWIRNPDSVLQSGNVYYNQLYEKFNKTGMTGSPHLTDADIDDILAYISEFRSK